MPEGLAEVLAAWSAEDPARAQRAEATLRRLLASRGEGPGAREGSALTMPGCPWELAFCSLDPAWRYTVEVGPPEDPGARLDHALRLLEALGGALPDAAVVAALRALQRGRPLRQGAHIGARHGADGDRFKLYAELPGVGWRDAEARFAPWLHAPLRWHGEARGLRAELLGLGPEPGQLELYGHLEGLYPGELSTLLAPQGLERRAPEVLTLLRAGLRWPDQPQLPGQRWGFSYSHPGRTATVYTLLRTFFGPDGASRQALLDLSARFGLNLGYYPTFSESLAGRRGFLCRHGMLGVVVPAAGPLGVWVGLAPPGGGT